MYIKSEGEIGKNRVVKAIEIGFILLGKRKKLVISVPTRFAANSISKNTVFTILGVINWAKKNYQIKINLQWLYCSLLIINKVNMIDLKLLISINK